MKREQSAGERIRELRGARGLTLKDLAQRSGYSYQAIAAYEKGSRRVGVEQALRLAQALQCPLRDILGGDAADALDVADGVVLADLPRRAADAPCVAIRDPLACAAARTQGGARDALTQRERSAQALENARYMEYLASSYETVMALLDDCLGEGAGLIALRLLSAYARLNAPGRERCVELMEDLGAIPRFARNAPIHTITEN